MNIGVMAIAAVIGAGGLGLLLLNGIGGSDIRMLIAGALMICLLAIVLDWLLHRLQVVLTPKGFDNDKSRTVQTAYIASAPKTLISVRFMIIDRKTF